MRAIVHSWLWLLRRSALGLLGLLIGIVGFELIQPVAISSFGDLSRIEAIVGLVPSSFLALMNVSPGFLSAVGLPGYLSLGFTHPVYHLLSSAAVIWFAGRTLAGEMERGSIQLSLSRPMSRTQVYLARVLGLLTVIGMVVVLGPLGMIAGILIAQPDGTMTYGHFVTQGLASALLLAGIGGVTLLISAAADRMGQAIGIAIGALVISYVIDYFAALWSALEPLEPFSIFDYYDPPAAMASGTISSFSVVVLLVIAAMGTTLGWWVFRNRDLPV